MLNVLLTLLLLAATDSASAATRYVWQSSPSPAPPFTNWTTAAHVLQDAVDAAQTGDTVRVAGGVYATGGRAVSGTMTNRVAIDRAITVESLMGPEVTIIQGRQVPGTTNGDGAIRCVYLTNGASLAGFTLTNGATRQVGDNETYLESGGGGVWCETNAVVSNCVISGNSAYWSAGGAYRGTLNNCTLNGNCARSWGGGAYAGRLNNCTLTGNSAGGGGGAAGGVLNNCTLTGNSASSGGGAVGGTLNNCTLTGNSAESGGGASDSGLNNCTVTGNSARHSGGGVGTFFFGSSLNNCIVYFNTAPAGANYDEYVGDFNSCCTTPLPPYGEGNITLDPQLASASHLSASSPCRGAGRAADTTGTDIDGEAWATPPSIGCDEYRVGAVTGPLSVNIVAAYTNVTVGFPVEFTALIQGRTTASAWEFGGGVVVSNRPSASHAWAALGDYAVVLRAYNESQPGGVGATVTIHVVAPPVHYVAADSANPIPPYTSWTTAATNIQDAVDAATVPWALVLVSNGVYATGGRAVYGNMTNRVAVYKPVVLRSVNGPEFTIIQGWQVPGTTNGEGAIRCVSLTSGASLSGFTLTNGATQDAWDEDRQQGGGGGVWCESTNAVLTNCVLVGNSAYDGGGAYRGTLNHCILSGNATTGSGGGASASTLNNCTITNNSAYDGGGGASESALSNCTLSRNTAKYVGGGALGGTLNNCTLTGNSTSEFGNGGGAAGGTLYNCIVYFNTAPDGPNYDSGSSLNYCCTTPQPSDGFGNISLDPQLASASHLSVGSPCRGAGSLAYTTGTDIDGEAWADLPSIGCDEYHAGAITGPLSVGIAATFTNVAANFPVELTGLIEGHANASVWSFGDDMVVSNRPYATHAWTAPGDYAVVLQAYNESHLAGVSATLTVRVQQGLHYAGAGNASPVPPYTSWATAATNIQDAVDAAVPGALVWVTNGLYATGGRAAGTNLLVNRVMVDKPLRLQSVNGPSSTIIRGYQVPGTTNGDGAIRCVYLANGASLSGFTLTNGATRTSADWLAHGGGLLCESPSAAASNCVLAGNSAVLGGGAFSGTLNNCTLTGNSAGFGGGAFSSTLNNCTLRDNSAYWQGGGADQSTLNNCTLVGNRVTGTTPGYARGGGAAGGTLNNCIAYYNSALNGANYLYAELNFCCTTPQPSYGLGNITNAPLFVNYPGGNLRLQSNSPCINAGLNAYAPGPMDLDGRPRIIGGTVDIGAYENTDGLTANGLPWNWLLQFGLPTDGSADATDPDADGHATWQEWRCQTNPTNALSVLRLLSASPVGTNVTVSWQSVAGVNYFLERSTNLWASPPFTLLSPNLSGQPGTTTYTDTNAAAVPRLFYRVGVGP